VESDEPPPARVLDSRVPPRSSLRGLERRLERARRLFLAREKLSKQGAISSQLLDDAQADVDAVIDEIESQAEQTADEVDLLRVQLEGKRAWLNEAEARLKQASDARALTERHVKQNVAAQGELTKANGEVLILKARCDARRAEADEVEVRWNQAKRRLSELKRLKEKFDNLGKPPTPSSAAPR
jgi:chromosome segregation ATPase